MMGDKITAREVAKRIGLPLVPGSPGPVDNIEEAIAAAEALGFPVLFKAAAGGGGAAAPSSATSPANAPRVSNNEQKSRDSDARAILESELRKAETRHAELLKEYNNGEPEKMGNEARNHQKYLDRVAELKASIARNESDIAGIRRELGRSPAPAPASAGAAPVATAAPASGAK